MKAVAKAKPRKRATDLRFMEISPSAGTSLVSDWQTIPQGGTKSTKLRVAAPAMLALDAAV